MSKGDIARDYFLQGYNCSQSVALAFSDIIGLDTNKIACLISGFGGGIGRMREVCGAVSGIAFVMSSVYGYCDPKDTVKKAELYSRIQSVGEQFKDANGSVVCRELLELKKEGFDSPTPEKRSNAYYKKRPCPELVKYAADLLEQYIDNNPRG